jgi:hypothetical protein
MARARNGAYGVGMLGRALFTLVWLIIAAGLMLPMYPVDVEPAPASDPMLHAAGFAVPGCQDCPDPGKGGADCEPACSCARVLPTAFVAAGESVVHVIVGSRPLGLWFESRSLRLKSPAI